MSSRIAASHRAVASAARLRPRLYRKLIGERAAIKSYHRDVLLEAVAMAAKELLRTTGLQKSLPKVAEGIGSAAGVDRTHIFLVDGARRDGRILQHCVWTVPGLVTPREFSNPTMPMAEAWRTAWKPPPNGIS